MRTTLVMVLCLALFAAAAGCSRTSVAPGTLYGTAEVFGQPDNAGIRVSVRNHAVTTETDPGGAYELRGVPTGLVTIDFTYPGYASEVVERLPIAAGANELRLVSLGRGEQLARVELSDMAPVEGTGDAVLRPTTGGLLYWSSDQHRLDTLSESGSLTFERTCNDGTGVVFSTGGRGELSYWSKATGVTSSVTDRGVDADCHGGFVIALHGSPQAGAELSLWSETGGATTIGTNVGSFELNPSGDTVLYVRDQDSTTARGTLVAWDVATRTELATTPNAYDYLFASDGANALYSDGPSGQAGNVALWRFRQGTSFLMSSSSRLSQLVSGKDPDAYLLSGTTSPTTDLSLCRVSSGTCASLSSTARSGSARLAGDGKVAVFIEGSSPYDLVVWDIAAGARAVVLSDILWTGSSSFCVSPNDAVFFVDADWTPSRWSAGTTTTIPTGTIDQFVLACPSDTTALAAGSYYSTTTEAVRWDFGVSPPVETLLSSEAAWVDVGPQTGPPYALIYEPAPGSKNPTAAYGPIGPVETSVTYGLAAVDITTGERWPIATGIAAAVICFTPVDCFVVGISSVVMTPNEILYFTTHGDATLHWPAALYRMGLPLE